MSHHVRRLSLRAGALAGVLLIALAAAAEGTPEVASRSIEIWSDGTRLAGDLFWPQSWKEGEKLPAIVLCHGWGGTKRHLNQAYAPRFAAQGYFVLTFDYRGWGESDGRLVAVGEIPEPDADGVVTVKAREIRDVVSPVERIEDIEAAISWLELEPGVDRHRIGLWGTSFGGGNVVAVAALDKRVKCVVSQVGDVNSRWGWVSAMKAMLAKYEPAEGSPEEIEASYGEVTRRLAERAHRVELLLRDGTITLDSPDNPAASSGLLAVGTAGADDPETVALVQAQNEDLEKLYRILARDPDGAEQAILYRRAQRARGLIDPFPQGIGFGTVPPMSGIAITTQMVQYSAADLADKITVPVLLIEAGKEELMDIEHVGGLLYRKLKGRVPVERKVMEGVSHFAIYRPPARDEAIKLASDWYDRYLKGGPEPAEREAVQSTLEAMAAAFQAKDLDAYMRYISAHFTSRHYFDKAGFREFLAQAWQELDFASSYDPTTITIDGDTARVRMYSTSEMGRFPMRTTLHKEADGIWRIISYE